MNDEVVTWSSLNWRTYQYYTTASDYQTTTGHNSRMWKNFHAPKYLHLCSTACENALLIAYIYCYLRTYMNSPANEWMIELFAWCRWWAPKWRGRVVTGALHHLLHLCGCHCLSLLNYHHHHHHFVCQKHNNKIRDRNTNGGSPKKNMKFIKLAIMLYMLYT